MCHQFYVIDSCVVPDFFTSQATILVMSLPTKQWIKCLGQVHTPVIALPLIYSRRVVVSYKRKYVHKLLVNRLLKPAQEKVWLSELTVPQ